jgi:hypothetical protein
MLTTELRVVLIVEIITHRFPLKMISDPFSTACQSEPFFSISHKLRDLGVHTGRFRDFATNRNHGINIFLASSADINGMYRRSSF